MIKTLALTTSILAFSLSSVHAVRSPASSDQTEVKNPSPSDTRLYRTVIAAERADERNTVLSEQRAKAVADKRASIITMLRDGLTPERIKKFFDEFSLEEIKAIKKEQETSH